jgi:hypothetical protein
MLPYPDRGVLGFQGLVCGTEQSGADRVHVDRVLQPGGEGRDDLVGIVTGSIEPAIHHSLDTAAQRIEQGGGGQGGGSHGHRRLDRKPLDPGEPAFAAQVSR